MRWLWLLILAVTMTCCVWPTNTDTTSGTGGSSTCPQTDTTCAECTSCALNGACATLWAACEADSDCEAIDQCWATCATGDTTCQQNCYADDSDAQSTYEAVLSCVNCTECPTACAGLCASS
jgi:hypothetical protein